MVILDDEEYDKVWDKATGLHIPQEFLTMIPYILTILALVGFVGKARAPKASGLPYEK